MGSIDNTILDKVKTAIANLDKATIKSNTVTDINSTYTFYQYEDGDTVNGIDPKNHPNSLIKEQINYVLSNGGTIVFVYINNKLTMMQYSDPFQAGIVPLTDPTTTFKNWLIETGNRLYLTNLINEVIGSI